MEQIRKDTNNQFAPFLRTNTKHSKLKIYEFFVNDNKKNKDNYRHPNNYVRTTKYNIFSFIPKSFLLQYAKLPNIYFLATAIIQSIPIISPLTNITAIIPLVFVLLVSIIRELIEDIARYKYDKQSNKEKVLVYRNDRFLESTSDTLSVGEIVYVKDNEFIPADMLLIDSSLNGGICYLKTSSLDGEKTLKEKEANKSVYGCFSLKNDYFIPKEIGKINYKGFCQCDYPNPDLNHLDGKITLSIDDVEVSFPIDAKQMILKASLLKHTGWITGIVLYTGLNNKILLNSKRPRLKISKMEKKMNTFLFFVFVFQIILCAGCSLAHQTQYNNNKDYYIIFLFYDQDSKMDSFLTFFTYLLLLNTLIPISLIVTLEIVRIIQGFFIRWDVELYSIIKKRFCKPANISLNEELGYVNYIFSDKTGTLTCNKMEFKYCVIGDACYKYIKSKDIYLETEPKESNNILTPIRQIRVQGKKTQMQFQIHNPLTQLNLHKNQTKHNIIPFRKNHFINLLNQSKEIHSKSVKEDLDTLHEFWQALACCHECVCNEAMLEVEYSGVSPDDIELVKAAADQGYSLQKSPNGFRRIIIDNYEKEMKILNILPFTSERRRMSIILQDGNQIKMYIKGADSEIRSRLSHKSKISYYDSASYNVDLFSSKGLRTLMVAYRLLSNDEYSDWNKKLQDSEMDLIKKQKLKVAYYDEIEKNFLLLGATMVEDKLQKNVPDTIRDLRLAGIKVWVLTGDKVDTAENIALSCNLITRTQKIFKICRFKDQTIIDKANLFPELEQFIIDFHAFANFDDDNFWYLNSSQSDGDFSARKKLSTSPFSIIIEGAILAPILQNEEFKSQFLKIALCASTVVCCRVSPLQKSLVVKNVKQFDHGSTTLAIGDGGNDVSMIMEAHIGIGIYGEEGLRAVQASDYAIGEFSLLRRLLFSHGRTNSLRISRMILYFFYKNFFFSIIHFFFCFYSLSSGQTIIDDWFITGFNLIFTALPLGIQAITDFDIVEKDGVLIKELMPFLYLESRDKPHFTYITFLLYLLKGLVLGAINYYFVKMASSEGSINSNGNNTNLWYCSVLLFTNIIVSVSITLLITQRNMTIFLPVVMGVTSFGLYFGFIFFVHYCEMFNSFGTMIIAFQSPNFYMVLLLICIIGFVIDYSFHSSRYFMSENLSTKLMWWKNNNKLNDNLVPEVIARAKQNLEIMGKYNNYNVVANTSLSCTQINFQHKADDLLNINKKKMKFLKHTVQPTSNFDLKKLDNPFNKQYSKQINSIFKLSSYENKTGKKIIKPIVFSENKYPPKQSNDEALKTKEQNPGSSVKLANNSMTLKNSMDGLNQ